MSHNCPQNGLFTPGPQTLLAARGLRRCMPLHTALTGARPPSSVPGERQTRMSETNVTVPPDRVVARLNDAAERGFVVNS